VWISLSAEDGHPGRVATRNSLAMQLTDVQMAEVQELISSSRVPRAGR
jgi:hypothetical protein